MILGGGRILAGDGWAFKLRRVESSLWIMQDQVGSSGIRDGRFCGSLLQGIGLILVSSGIEWIIELIIVIADVSCGFCYICNEYHRVDYQVDYRDC